MGTPEMSQNTKEYRGRNPSPPDNSYDFMSSSNMRLLFLKPVKTCGPHQDFPDENIIKEALLRSRLFEKISGRRNQDADRNFNLLEGQSDSNNQELPSLQTSNISEIFSRARLETEKASNQPKEQFNYQKSMSQMTLNETLKENRVSVDLLKSILSNIKREEDSDEDLSRNRMLDRKEDSTDYGYEKHMKKNSRRNQQELDSYDSSLNKTERTFEEHKKEKKTKRNRRRSQEEFDSSDDSSNKERTYKGKHNHKKSKKKSSRRDRKEYDYYDGSSNKKERTFEEYKHKKSTKRICRRNQEELDSSDDSSIEKERTFEEEYKHKKSTNRNSRRNREVLDSSDGSSSKKERTFEDDLKDFMKYRKKSKFREDSFSSDDRSECSYKYSHKRTVESKAKDSVRKRTEYTRQHSNSGSDTSVNVASKPPKEYVSENSKDRSDNEEKSQSKITIKEEKNPESPGQSKLSPELECDSVADDDDSQSAHIELTTELIGRGDNHYYCEVCQLNLNGKVTYDTHIKGKKHKKAVNARFPSEQSLDQYVGSNSNDSLSKQASNKNLMVACFEKAKFQEKIDEYKESPIVGLDYVDEIHNIDGTISYCCNLCEAPCTQSSVFQHIIGFRHLLKFLGTIDHVYHERIVYLPKKVTENKVRDRLWAHERKFGRKPITVKKCVVDSTQIPSDDPCPSHKVNSMLLEFKEEDFEMNADNYLDDSGNYYCNICDAHMNNINMFHSHLVGKRHLKNVKKTSGGLGPPTTGSSSKKKAPANTISRLEEQLPVDFKEPIVGLNHIRETQNPNGEIYMCFICNCSASIDIIDHITSYKHRTRFLETVNANGTIPNSIDLLRKLDLIGQQGRENIVKEECEKIEKEHGRGKVEVYR